MRDTILNSIRLESILIMAGIAMLVGSMAHWQSAGVASAAGIESWHGNLSFIGGWLVIFGGLVKYKIFGSWRLQQLRPYSDHLVPIVGCAMSLVGALLYPFGVDPPFSISWGLYLTIAASAVALILILLALFGGRLPGGRRRAGGL